MKVWDRRSLPKPDIYECQRLAVLYTMALEVGGQDSDVYSSAQQRIRGRHFVNVVSEPRDASKIQNGILYGSFRLVGHTSVWKLGQSRLVSNA